MTIESRCTARLPSRTVKALVNETLRDTEPDDLPIVIESRIPDLSREDHPWDATVTEPIPAPVFAEAMRRLERVVLLGALIVGLCITVAVWMSG